MAFKVIVNNSLKTKNPNLGLQDVSIRSMFHFIFRQIVCCKNLVSSDVILLALRGFTSITVPVEYWIIFNPLMILMIMINLRAVTRYSKYLGTSIDRRIAEPSKHFTNIITLAFSKV